MKLETFFHNFELLTDAPNAVVKLREIILQLAVRGKLVPQDSIDEPASILLQKIEVQIEKSNSKKSKLSIELTNLNLQQIPYEVPSTWQWVRLSNVGRIVGGGTPSTVHTEYYSNNGIPWLTPADLYNLKEKIVCKGKRDISLLGLNKSSAQLMPKGTVLFSSRAPIGYVAIAANDLATNQGFKSCIPYMNETSEYIYYFLKSAAKQIDSKASGTTFKEISGKEFSLIPIPLPPLAEQKRIVEKCDRLLSICDEIEKRQQQRQESIVRMNESAIAQLFSSQNPDEFSQHWQRICNNFDLLYSIPETIPKLRQAILELAVQGKLVRQDPNDEPASALIERMITQRDKLIANKKINNYRPQPPVEADDITFNLPEGWQCVRLGEITDIVSGVTKGRNFIGRQTTYYPYLRVANVQRGFLDLEVMKEIEIPVEELEKYRLQFGDILLTEGGDWDKLGRSAIWQGQIQDCIHQNHVFRARPLIDGLLSEWAVMYTNSPIGRQYFETAAKRTTNLASINMTQLRYCPFPLPPVEEQKRIIAKVNRLMSLCDTLEAKLKEARSHSETLMEVAAKQILTA